MTPTMRVKVNKFNYDWQPASAVSVLAFNADLLELIRAAQEEAWEREHHCGYVHVSAHQEHCYCPYRKDES